MSQCKAKLYRLLICKLLICQNEKATMHSHYRQK